MIKLDRIGKKALWQLAGMILAIVLVMMIFRTIEPVRVAALVAGSVFLIVSLGVIFSESRWGRGNRSLALWTSVFFLGAFVIPIFGIRLIYWESDFKDLYILGMRAQTLHELSSRCYLLLMGMVIYEGLRPHLPGRRSKSSSTLFKKRS